MLYFYGVKTELLKWSMSQPAEKRAQRQGGGKHTGLEPRTADPRRAAATGPHARPGQSPPPPGQAVDQRAGPHFLVSLGSEQQPPLGPLMLEESRHRTHGTVSRCPVQVRAYLEGVSISPPDTRVVNFSGSCNSSASGQNSRRMPGLRPQAPARR